MQFRKHLLSAGLVVLPILWVIGFIVPHLLVSTSDGVSVGYEHIWSDWPLHISIASIFAFKSPSLWFTQHPLFGNGPMNYPFVMDMISGVLMRLHLSLVLSFLVPTVVCLLLVSVGWYILSFSLTHSRLAATLSCLILIGSSGLGWLQWARSPWLPLQFFSRIDAYQWYAGNLIVGLLLPQRAFLLGMTVGVWSLIGLLRSKRMLPLMLSGLIAGILPIVHVHSFIAVVLFAGALCLSRPKRWKHWTAYVVSAGVLSIPLTLWFIFLPGSGAHLVKLLVGWTASGGILGWLLMWWRLWGLALPLSLIGFMVLWRHWTKAMRAIGTGTVLLFGLANVVLFQPIPWDNSKLFLWSYLGFGIILGSLLAHAWRKKLLGKLLACVLLVALCGTGVLDLIHAADPNGMLQIGSSDDLAIGAYVKSHTPESSIFLTSASTDAPVMTWGNRSIVMGFTPWVENFGFQTSQVGKDIQLMYDGNHPELLNKYHVSFVVIGPSEEADFHPNDDWFNSHAPVLLENFGVRIYDVRKIQTFLANP